MSTNDIPTTELPLKRPHDKIKNENTPSASVVQPVQCRAGKPNNLLTKEEKEQKKLLKKIVKIQAKHKAIKTRIRHAVKRKDHKIEIRAREELQELITKHGESIEEMSFEHRPDGGGEGKSNTLEDDIDKKSRGIPFIQKIASKLFEWRAAMDKNTKSIKSDGTPTKSTSIRQDQSVHAVKLLKHMTKGTQDMSMFKNEDALWGYTRQKFYERAFLLCTSLAKLNVNGISQSHFIKEPKGINSIAATSTSKSTFEVNADPLQEVKNQQLKTRERAWNKISEGHIRRACSIGCGPGNDAVGLISFLHLHSEKYKESPLEKILLLDWSIEDWNESVLSPLRNILVEHKLATEIKAVFCDVIKDLREETNGKAWNDITNNRARNLSASSLLENQESSEFSDYDIFLISYLLSETRGKWEAFFRQLVIVAKSGSIFYFAEPTPWQLHRFIDVFKNDLDFVWVDSSMDFPSLQLIDRRAGPAVLVAVKK